MKELILIAIGSALVNNVVLSQFLGICPFLGVSKRTDTAAGMGGAVIFVITISSLLTSIIYNYLLVGLHIEYLKTIVFILVIAALVQFVEMFLKRAAHHCISLSEYISRSSQPTVRCSVLHLQMYRRITVFFRQL